MASSPLVDVEILSPNNSGKRTEKISRITPHCVVGHLSIASLGNMFKNPEYKASSNYGIDDNGYIGEFVPESYRSWCSSSSDNDQKAVTIECASDTYEPFAMSDKVYSSLVTLCADICKRNGKSKLIWIPDKTTALKYSPGDYEMQLTVHRWFKNKSCPGDWLYNRLHQLAKDVNDILSGQSIFQYSIYRLYVGSNSDDKELLKSLINVGFVDAYIVPQGGYPSKYGVQVGAYRQISSLKAPIEKLKSCGFNNIFITVE